MKVSRVILIVVVSITMLIQTYAGNYQNINQNISQVKGNRSGDIKPQDGVEFELRKL